MYLLKVCVNLMFILILCIEIQTAKILMIWTIAAKSHKILGEKLLEELAHNNHQITMISPYETNITKSNVRRIKLNGVEHVMKNMLPTGITNFLEYEKLSSWVQMTSVSYGGELITAHVLSEPGVQKILNDPNEHFDLIIFEMFHTEALFGFAHKFDAPVVVLSTLMSSAWTNHLVGNPAPSTYIPDFFIKLTGNMSLTERIYSTIYNLMNEIYRKYFYFPRVDATLHKHFPDAPHIFPLMYNRTALVLLNSHPAISQPAPHVPAMVEVGGFHVQAPGALPAGLQQLLDGAPDGVVLFSMGSNIRGVDLTSSTKQAFLQAFARLKQTVIWKFEEDLPDKPNNVHIMKWCPQNDIMGHPNLKLFITHGGLLSTTESVYHGVPIIGIPIFSDQVMNIRTIIEKGYGLSLSINQITEDNVYNTIKEVLMNPKYKQNINTASNILRNQPVKPMDSAMFWIEHVIKHRGAKTYRSAAMDLQWYQLYSLDIIFTFLALILSIYYCIKSFINYVFKNHTYNNSEKKKND